MYGVCVGGVLGHALCTGLAVLGGRLIATRISVRTVTLVSIHYLTMLNNNINYFVYRLVELSSCCLP